MLLPVDTPTKGWKTSNPKGITSWVDDQAKRTLIRIQMVEDFAKSMSESVSSVPDQEVPLSDTLRVAIRLFKRHRDMAIQRNNIEKEFKPISVIIVTLLTQCFEGLADLGKMYSHPMELLIDLTELMPGMIEKRNGEYWVANPTVEGENFAEKWNEDKGKRCESFDNWCGLLISDMQSILKLQGEKDIRDRIKYVFGSTGAEPSPKGPVGLSPAKPDRIPPMPKKEVGLA